MSKSELQYRVSHFKWNSVHGMEMELVSYRVIDTICPSYSSHAVQFGVEEERFVYDKYYPRFTIRCPSSELDELHKSVSTAFKRAFLSKPFTKIVLPFYLTNVLSEDEPYYTINFKDFIYEINSYGLGAIIRKDREQLGSIMADWEGYPHYNQQSKKIVHEEFTSNIERIEVQESTYIVQELKLFATSYIPNYEIKQSSNRIKYKIKDYFKKEMPKECVFSLEDVKKLRVENE